MIKKYFFLPHIIILIIGIIIGSFFDFQINQVLYSERNAFGIFVAAFGEYPAYFMIGFLGSYLVFAAFKHFLKEDKRFFAHNLACGILGVVLSSYYFGNAITNANGYMIIGPMKAVWFIIAFFLVSPSFVLGYFIARKSKKEEWRIVFYILFALAVSILFTTLVKEIMHRPRFRSIVANDAIPFKNWWEPTFEYKHFINDIVVIEDFKSFPSGHANITTTLIGAPYLIQLFTSKKPRKTRIFLEIVCCVYALFVSFTRMLVGAHFLTDVCFGGIITVIVYIIFIGILHNKKLLDF